MNDLVVLIQEHIPSIAGAITGIVFVVFLILNIADDFDKIISFCKKVIDFRKHIDKIYYSKKRDRYNKTLITTDFIDWQRDVLEKIYEPLIKKKTEQGWDIKFTELEIGTEKEKYESVTMRMEAVSFPFQGICDKHELEAKKDITKAKYGKIKDKYSRVVNKYYRLVRGTIRYPKRVGYMLEDIKCGNENKSWNISAHTGTYEDNIKTSHVLEYELFELYKKLGPQKRDVKKYNKDSLLKMLPIRNDIHQSFRAEKDESNILISGKHRESLLSVQMFVMVRNHSGNYDALRIRRSADVSAKANYLQFIPSGGFEAMNDCNDFDSQWDNYSISKVIFRELLEECFGVDEDEKGLTANNISPDRIYHNNHIKRLLDMMDGSENEKPKAYLELMGTTMSLAGLRQELSFILRVDEPDFASALISNYESKSAIHLVGIKELENSKFWCREDENTKINDLKVLNCTSAGLFELARGNSLYKEVLENKGK